MKLKFVLMLIGIVLVSGCISQTAKEYVVVKYVCPDGSSVNKPDSCSLPTVTPSPVEVPVPASFSLEEARQSLPRAINEAMGSYEIEKVIMVTLENNTLSVEYNYYTLLKSAATKDMFDALKVTAAYASNKGITPDIKLTAINDMGNQLTSVTLWNDAIASVRLEQGYNDWLGKAEFETKGAWY